MMRAYLLILLLASLPALLRADAPTPVVFNRAQFFPASGHEQDMVGGKFLGSNISRTEGFELLGVIKITPATAQWTELTFPNTKVYRWIRYEAPPGSHGRVAKLKCFSGEHLLVGDAFGSFPAGDAAQTLDGESPTGTDFFQGEQADGQYIGLDLGDAATSSPPSFSPDTGEYPDPVTVTLKSAVPSAIIRYTTDGTRPTPENGHIYSAPIPVERRTTLCAALFEGGKAPTRTVNATYIIGHAIAHNRLHIGNSLTGITGNYTDQVFTSGYKNDPSYFTIGGGLTKTLWNAAMTEIGDPADQASWIKLYTQSDLHMDYSRADIEKCRDDWKKLWPLVTSIDDFTLQPRDFDIAEEADYDNRFLKLILQKAPQARPWLYIEWVEKERQRPTDLGQEPTTEMTKVWPAATWEESMGAMTLYGEDLHRKIDQTYQGAQSVRIIPAALAMGWFRHLVEAGQFPGVAREDFYPRFFDDHVHLNDDGVYLIDCLWYAAFHGESPEDTFLPVLTGLTSPQARAMQRLAWDVVKNYPGCGYYEEGTAACAAPEISAGPTPMGETAPITLSSPTPGAWFRYTLDGTVPTRDRGYVYCGVVTVRPGFTLKAIAYKSGMAESAVTEKSF